MFGSTSVFRRVVTGLALGAAVVVAAGLAACGTGTVDMQEATKLAVRLDDARMPADVKLVAAGLILRMKGFDDRRINGLEFPAAAADNLKELGFHYDGFVPVGLSVLNRSIVDGATELSGLIVFKDDYDRRTAVRFLANYRVAAGAVTVEHASIVPVSTTTPRVEAYIVPYDPSVDFNVVSADHGSLYSYAVNNAVTPATAAAGKKDYDVYLFVMDRSSPTSKDEGWISENQLRTSGYGDSTSLLDYNGWKVAIISGELDPKAQRRLYAKLLHTPGEELGWLLRYTRMPGLFRLTAGG